MKQYKYCFEFTKKLWNNLQSVLKKDEKENQRHWDFEVKEEYVDYFYVSVKCTPDEFLILKKLLIDAKHWGETFEPCCSDCPFDAKKFSDCSICFDEDIQERWSQSRRGIRSATGGDYGSNARWNAPGMSVRDFI